jgi:hypothetical protein
MDEESKLVAGLKEALNAEYPSDEARLEQVKKSSEV